MSARRVVVIGGGIAGLATAWLLRDEARGRGQSIDLTVLEAGEEAGGFTRTEVVDGFVCEWGPNGFLDNAPRTLELVERVGLSDRLIAADEAAARRFVYHSGRLHQLPTGPGSFLRSRVLPWSSKLRVLGEPLVRPKRDGADETIDAFARRRLGAGFANYLLDPMVSGVFAGDPSQLSLRASFPKMARLEDEHGGLFRALAARKRRGASGGPSGPGGTLRSFRRGMGELTTSLAQQLDDVLHLRAPARALRLRDGGFSVALDGDVLDADVVILACPAHAARHLVAPFEPDVAQVLGAIPFAPVSVACEGFDRAQIERPLDGFGVLVPRSEGMRSLGTLLSDRIFPVHAPEGHRILRTLVGGARDPEVTRLDDAGLSDVVHRDLDTLFGLEGDPAVCRLYHHERAIAQYTVGHLDRVARIDRLSAERPGLLFTGASYRGVSVNGCVEDAFRLSEQVLAA